MRTITVRESARLKADALKLPDTALVVKSQHLFVFDCDVLTGAWRKTLRRLTPTGSVEFDRQRLLAAYQPVCQQRETLQVIYNVDVFSSLFPPRTLWEECVESSGLNPLLAFFLFFSYILEEIAARCREAVRLQAKALAGKIAIDFLNRLRCGLKFKVLHTPLQMFPRSIHPIELSA